MSVGTDEFGFLDYRKAIWFEGGVIKPGDKFADDVAWIKVNCNKDGFLYPPMEGTIRCSWPRSGQPKPIEEWEKQVVPNSRRPASLWAVPVSHRLVVDVEPCESDFRKGVGGFLMQAAAYLFGTRLQFRNWWFDGRVPIRSTHGVVRTRQGQGTHQRIEAFFSTAYAEWRSCEERERLLLSNILYMVARAPSYQWAWERFTIDYMVFDACYRFAVTRRGTPHRIPHSDRLRRMCEQFGVASDGERFQEMVSLRNDLFHEGLWEGASPGDSQSLSKIADDLHRLNQRLILALLRFDSEMVSDAWWSFSRGLF